MARCFNCESFFSPQQEWHKLCPKCYFQNRRRCSQCFQLFRSNDIDRNGNLCPSCYREKFTKCTMCSRKFFNPSNQNKCHKCSEIRRFSFCKTCKNNFHPDTPFDTQCKKCAPKGVCIRFETPADCDYESLSSQAERLQRMLYEMTGQEIKCVSLGKFCDGCSVSVPVNQSDFKCNLCNTRFDLCPNCQKEGLDLTRCPKGWGCKVRPELIEQYGKIL